VGFGSVESQGLSKMGVVEGLLALALVLNVVVVSNGGKSSLFIRKTKKTVDMPLGSDVFSVPRGYNAPQQVHTLPFSSLCTLSGFALIFNSVYMVM